MYLLLTLARFQAGNQSHKSSPVVILARLWNRLVAPQTRTKNLLCKLGRCFVGRIQERFWTRLVHLLLTPAIVVKPEMKSVPKNSTKFDWIFVGNLGGSNSAFWTRLVLAPCKSKACRCAPDAARLTCMPPACQHMPTARRWTPYLHACIGPLHAAAPPSPAAGRPAA